MILVDNDIAVPMTIIYSCTCICIVVLPVMYVVVVIPSHVVQLRSWCLHPIQ